MANKNVSISQHSETVMSNQYDSIDLLDLHPNVAYQFKRLGAKMVQPPLPVPEYMDLTFLDGEQEIVREFYLPKKFRNIFSVELCLCDSPNNEHLKAFWEISESERELPHEEIQNTIDFSIPQEAYDANETQDTVPIPIVSCLADEYNAILSFYDMRNKRALEEGNPIVAKIDDGSWFDPEEYEYYTLSEFMDSISVYNTITQQWLPD